MSKHILVQGDVDTIHVAMSNGNWRYTGLECIKSKEWRSNLGLPA